MSTEAMSLEEIRKSLRKLPDNAPVKAIHGALIGICDHLMDLSKNLKDISEDFGGRTVVLRDAQETLNKRVEDVVLVLRKTVQSSAEQPSETPPTDAPPAEGAAGDDPRHPVHPDTAAADLEEKVTPPTGPTKDLSPRAKADLERIKATKEPSK